MSIESKRKPTLHGLLTIAALCAAVAVPLPAPASLPSGGGAGHASGGGFGVARTPGVGMVMHPPTLKTQETPDRKFRRYHPNYNWEWYNRQPSCNSAMWLQPQLALGVYGTVPVSCWWQSPPLWLP